VHSTHRTRDAGRVPDLSVVMAVFNGEDFLRPALDSLLAQTFADFELIVVDDGSTDGTWEIVSGYAARDRRIVPLRNERNHGLLYSRTRGFRECRARIIAIADADDIFNPQRFEKQLAYLRAHPTVGFLGCGAELVNKAGHRIGANIPPSEHRHIRFLSLLGSCMWDTSTIYRVEVLQAAGGYDAAITGGGLDYDLWARLMDLTECHNLPDALVKVRLHERSQTAILGRTLANQVRVARRLLTRYLGRTVTHNEATDALTLFSHGWRIDMTPAAIARALTLLQVLRKAATTRESRDTQLAFRILAARSMLQQAGVQLRNSRRVSLALLLEACRWYSRIVGSRGFVRYSVRLVIPRAFRFKPNILRQTRPTPAD
jgi:glycosyltransferase involved in cell wall biosynthesis